MQDSVNDIFVISTTNLKRLLLISLMTAALSLFSAENAKNCDINIGVLANRGKEKCIEQWTPTAVYLTDHIPGYTFHIVPILFKDVVPQVKSHKLDFILVNPGIYIKLEEEYGAARIATLLERYKNRGYSRYGGVIITRSDRSDIKNASDLKCKTFAAPASNSFFAWNAICRELQSCDVNFRKDFRKIKYLGSHDLVVQAVKNGDVDAGSVRSDVLERLVDTGKIKLEDFRILCPKKITAEFPFFHSTRIYPVWPFAVLPDAPAGLSKKVSEALLHMPPDCSAATSADSTGWAIPENYESVKDCLKAVKAPPYEHYGEVTFTQALHQHWEYFLIVFLLLLFVFFLAVHLLQRNRQILKSTEVIRDNEEKLRNIFENSSNVFYSHTPKGTVTYISPQIQDLIGYTQEESYGHWSNFITDNPINQTAIELTKKAIETGKPQPPYELEMRHKDGHHVIVEVREKPLVKDGKTVAVTGALIDITERKQAQENLRATLDCIGDAVISTDKDGMILEMNPAAEKLTDWKASEAKGNHYNTIFSALNSESGNSVAELIKDKLLSNDVIGFDEPITLNSKYRGECKISIASSPMKDAAGKTTGIIFVLRDITRELKAMETLKKVERLNSIGMLAGGIAHDFNNILTAVFGNISIAKLKLQEDHPAYRFIHDAEKSIGRATSLTLQLLTFAKGGAPVKEEVNLCKIVEDVVHFDLAGSNVKPIIKIADDLWDAKADKGQIQQVFSNLTINANQAMPEGGHLYITVENSVVDEGEVPNLAPGRYIRAVIRDEGTGIDEKHLKIIFDPYFTTKQTGNGLGLATTYSIMVKHGGIISAKSKVGEGTTFTLYIPASDSQSSAETGTDEEDNNGMLNPENRKILVMDDEEVIQSLLETILGDAGYSVITAEDGQKALDEYIRSIADGKAFDAVIMDLTVPGEKGGKEIVGEILEIDPSAKCIVSSGYSDDPVMANHTDYGFVATVSKPFCIKELLKVVSQVLREET